ncbi:hypothetical protein MI149_29410 (plasmid) [Mycolicibacterium crocinum]|uniref:Lipoprotein n=1 Tax=Mycolicibacterium crocinum TaxID=388459 RepID=A0ABY3TTW1_9MYCO|nr:MULTISPECIES: hypothetical protein [Mycolicibacterium]ULN44805.1 hypothetical protein MI149_29410 [Mycolicibacterium crocinum]
MRLNGIMIAGTIVAVTIAVSCSSDKSGPNSSSTETPSPASRASSSPPSVSPSSATPPPPSDPLGADACSDVATGYLDLMLSKQPDAARAAADVMEKYGPPDSVKAAIEHFVTTIGMQKGDPEADANDKLISDWVDPLCPRTSLSSPPPSPSPMPPQK